MRSTWRRWRNGRRSRLVFLPPIAYGTTLVAAGRRPSRRGIGPFVLVERTLELFG